MRVDRRFDGDVRHHRCWRDRGRHVRVRLLWHVAADVLVDWHLARPRRQLHPYAQPSLAHSSRPPYTKGGLDAEAGAMHLVPSSVGQVDRARRTTTAPPRTQPRARATRPTARATLATFRPTVLHPRACARRTARGARPTATRARVRGSPPPAVRSRRQVLSRFGGPLNLRFRVHVHRPDVRQHHRRRHAFVLHGGPVRPA